MADFAAARQNMVDSQIRTNKVTDPGLLRALAEMPRERFLARHLVGRAGLEHPALSLAEAPAEPIGHPADLFVHHDLLEGFVRVSFVAVCYLQSRRSTSLEEKNDDR